jgi:hypothetical protein
MMGNFEPLNETGHDGRGLVVRGKHWLILGDTFDVTKLQSTFTYEKFHSDWITFSKTDSDVEYRRNFATKVCSYIQGVP